MENPLEKRVQETGQPRVRHLAFKMQEHDEMMFHRLELNRLCFETDAKIRVQNPEELKIQLESDTEFNFYLQDDPLSEKKIVCSANWVLLGNYAVSSDPVPDKVKEIKDDDPIEDFIDRKFTWIWSWCIFPDEHNEKVKKATDALPEHAKALSEGVIEFDDPLIVSYILGYLTETLGLEYIYVHFIDGSFHAFGLSNMKWHMEPDPELKKAYDNKILEKYNQNMRGKKIEWESLFKLFKGLSNTDIDKESESYKKQNLDNNFIMSQINKLSQELNFNSESGQSKPNKKSRLEEKLERKAAKRKAKLNSENQSEPSDNIDPNTEHNIPNELNNINKKMAEQFGKIFQSNPEIITNIMKGLSGDNPKTKTPETETPTPETETPTPETETPTPDTETPTPETVQDTETPTPETETPTPDTEPKKRPPEFWTSGEYKKGIPEEALNRIDMIKEQIRFQLKFENHTEKDFIKMGLYPSDQEYDELLKSLQDSNEAKEN